MRAATSTSVRRTTGVRWAEMLPLEFKRRREACPVVYLPLGVCEPHGEGAALGLDLLKAEAWCVATAQRAGGIVAPSFGFHVHECGPSARWLRDKVGEVEPHLTSIGPTAFVHCLLHQLRALANSEFGAALIVSGHSGAHAADLAKIVADFGNHFGFACRYVTDFDLAMPEFSPDHAGFYELSLLMHLRPELVDSGRIRNGAVGAAAFALDPSAIKASARAGRRIFSHLVARLAALNRQMADRPLRVAPPITISTIEDYWDKVSRHAPSWHCARPREGQAPVPSGSRWKSGEFLFG